MKSEDLLLIAFYYYKQFANKKCKPAVVGNHYKDGYLGYLAYAEESAHKNANFVPADIADEFYNNRKLVIKDDINLKLLEKFGFEKQLDSTNKYVYSCYVDESVLVVDAVTREFYYDNTSYADLVCDANEVLIKVYELAKAGLLQRMEDRNV